METYPRSRYVFFTLLILVSYFVSFATKMILSKKLSLKINPDGVLGEEFKNQCII